ncbi:LapD/MoxY N-terminal periplasmic domain-containing protein, partial [Klebsiella pneumoniae]|uniref:LapD/MoxY N-terminal periplasmic domain-containing protein n=1 Tax=Klebsiella pneumoniae TaxID=573 RepID=UPI00301347E5
MNQGDGDSGYSLRGLLLLFVAALMVAVLVAGTYLSATRFSQYLSHQLQVQTHDAAVALGVSLSNVETDGEARRIIDAMFDSG